MNQEFYTKGIDQTLQELKTNAGNGLPVAEAKKRLEQNGPNRLQSAKKKS